MLALPLSVLIPATAPSAPARELTHRGAYLNIAYGFSAAPLSPDTWTHAQWVHYLDDLVAAGITHLHFFLWGDLELSVEGSAVNAQRNRELHQRLRAMIREAHLRGLKVGFWFSPSLIPRDIWEAHPGLHADSIYKGFPIVCLSEAESWDLMERVYSEELRWFRDADLFAIIPYDPGGCMCERCAPKQAELLLKLALRFGDVVLHASADAELAVCLWASWAVESEIGHSIREPFLEQLATTVPDPSELIIMDSGVEPRTSLVKAAELGFRPLVFEALTDWETAWWFPNPMFSEAQWILRRAIELDAIGLTTQCLRPGSKFVTTWLLGELARDPDIARYEALTRYAHHLTGDTDASQRLASALEMLDDAVRDGADRNAWAAIAAAADEAMADAAGERALALASLVDGAHLLSLASGSVNRPNQADALYADFADKWQSSVYAGAPMSRDTFDQIATWAREGWAKHRF